MNLRVTLLLREVCRLAHCLYIEQQGLHHILFRTIELSLEEACMLDPKPCHMYILWHVKGQLCACYGQPIMTTSFDAKKSESSMCHVDLFNVVPFEADDISFTLPITINKIIMPTNLDISARVNIISYECWRKSESNKMSPSKSKLRMANWTTQSLQGVVTN